jgi:hypothetical protein
MPKLALVKKSSEPKQSSFPSYSIKELQALQDIKCNSSMITPEQADANELYPITRAETENLLGYYFSDGIAIPYKHPLTRKPLPAHQKDLDAEPDGQGYIRIRNLHKTEGMRYAAPAGSSTGVYYPHYNWGMVIDDKHLPIYICEGELKAICMTAFYKVAAIGLSGVSSWSGKASLEDATPNLEMFKDVFRNREVVIVFDDDVAHNKDVVRELNKLLGLLCSWGARSSYICLPESDLFEEVKDKDTGKTIRVPLKNAIDDWAHRDPLHAPENFSNLPRYPHNVIAEFEKINEKYAVIAEGSHIGHIVALPKAGDRYPDLVSQENFDRVYRKKVTLFEQEWNDNKKKYVPKPMQKQSLASAWLESPLRLEVASPKFQPNMGLTFQEAGNKLLTYNLWIDNRPTPLKGPPGCLKPFFAMRRQIVGRGSPESVEAQEKWFTQWLAHSVRYPEKKMATGIVMVGEPGTGKSEMAEMIGLLHGSYAARLRQQDIDNPKFNGYLAGRTVLIGDEVNSKHKRDQADTIKNLITERKVSLELKNKEAETVQVYAQIVMTTNHRDGLILDNKERRLWVPYSETALEWNEVKQRYVVNPTRATMLGDAWCSEREYKEFQRKFLAQDESGKGIGVGLNHLMYYLMHEVDLSDFDNETRPPMTEAKKDMIETSQSHYATWMREFEINPLTCSWFARTYGSNKHLTDVFPLIDLKALYTDYLTNSQNLRFIPKFKQFKHAAEELGWVEITQQKLAGLDKKESMVAIPTLWAFDPSRREKFIHSKADELRNELIRMKHPIVARLKVPDTKKK